MRILLVFVSVVVAVSSLSVYEQWLSFKNDYGNTYENIEDESLRFEIFQDNLKKIKSHNARYERGELTYKMGINQFTDLTIDEFTKRRQVLEFIPEQPYVTFFSVPDNNAESSVDWRLKGAVFEVEDQGKCNSDWALSAVGALQGRNKIKHNQKVSPSIQELIDCSRHYDNYGCGGGWMHKAFVYIMDNGISDVTDYPYESKQKFCKNSTTPRLALKVTNYTLIDTNEEALRQAVEKVGPISVKICGDFIQSYEKGIFQHEHCPTDTPNQALLAVGYGTENGTDYWILKNSVGQKWGENGYIRLIRNKNNTCGVASHAMYPNIA